MAMSWLALQMIQRSNNIQRQRMLKGYRGPSMGDIVKDLRAADANSHCPGNSIMLHAAEEIEQLRKRAHNAEQNLLGAHKEIERLKAAAGHPKDDGPGG